MEVMHEQAPDRGLPAPDAVIYLAMTPEAAALRGGYGSERYEKVGPNSAHACLHTPQSMIHTKCTQLPHFKHHCMM